jgi:serine protease Do
MLPQIDNIAAKSNKKNSIILLVLIAAIIGGLIGGGITYAIINKKFSGTDSITGTKNIKVEENSATISAVEKVSPTVVSIVSTQDVQDIFGNVSQQKGGGTGFIITPDGLILTNKHVIDNTQATYTVFTSDGKNYKAKIKAQDPLNDLAVLKIEAKNLPVVDLGNSDDLKLGQSVIAIGNALGEFQNTITSGIISGIGRSIEASTSLGQTQEELQGLLQTDAPINPGNSGGPLINLDGQVIGINTAVASSAENIGFAIPINDAKTAIESVIKSGKIIRPMLGVRYISLTKDIAQYNNLPVESGAYIFSNDPTAPAVISGSPAEKAGLRSGDIILAINNDKIDENRSLKRLLQNYKPGQTVELIIIRDKKETKANVKLGEMK